MAVSAQMAVNAPDMTGGPPAPQFNRPSPVAPPPQTPGQAIRQPRPQVAGTDNAMRRAQQGAPPAPSAPPAPATPTRGILKPGATPTVANLLEDVRAGVNDSGTIGLDRLTGAPMSVVQMQNQGRDIANQIVDESIMRRALTDPRSLNRDNRTGIAPINLMAEMDRRAELEAERQAMQQRGAEYRATRPTSEQLRALMASDKEANAAMNLAKFGQRESPYQQRKAAERAEDRQRMRERMKQFEDIKYARIAMDRYGMAPTEDLSLRAAMAEEPAVAMQFMGQRELNQANKEIARAKNQTDRFVAKTDANTKMQIAELDADYKQQIAEAEKMKAEGFLTDLQSKSRIEQLNAENEAKKLGILATQAEGNIQVGAANAFVQLASNASTAPLLPRSLLQATMRNLGGMMAGPNAPAAFPQEMTMQERPTSLANAPMSEAPYIAQEIANSPAIRQTFKKLDNPFSIAWDIDSMMDNSVLPPEEMLQQISDYVAIQNRTNPAFMNRNNRWLPTIFGLTGGEMDSLDTIVAAPPGQKQQAYAQAMQKQYGKLPTGYNPQQPAPGLEARMAPARFPAQPPVAPGANVFNDPSYMQMAEQQLRQGGF